MRIGIAQAAICIIAGAGFAPAREFVSSGVEDIDAMRKRVSVSRTKTEDAQERNSLLNSWFRLLLHQGIVLDDTAALIPILSDQKHPRYLETIDEMYRVMETIQAKRVRYEEKRGSGASRPAAEPLDWPQFQRTEAQDGSTPEEGPSRGRIAWKFPIGHAWYSRPVLDESRVYVTSPGITTRLYCLDQATGKLIWKNRQHALHAYGSARMTSSPVLAGESVVIRGSGQRDHQDSFPSARLLYVDRATGATQKTVHAGHVDYRRGYSPVSGGSRYLAVLHGEQTIHHRPPLIRMLDTLALKDSKSGEELWRIRIGDTFGEPVLEGERVWLATDAGVVYSFHAQGRHRIAWSFQAEAPIRSALALAGETIYTGDQNGNVYAISKTTGELRWKTATGAKQERAFQLFSAAAADDGRIYIGAADGRLYCIDAATGAVQWKFQTSDWIRSRPVTDGGRIFLAAMNGEIHALRDAGARAEPLWKRRVTDHQVLSDLASRGGRVFVTSNDLYIHCLDGGTGRPLWTHSLLEAAHLDGRRYEADIVSGGADYQSSPTAADGKVFIGGPNRFVYAIDAKTGKEVWRFEASGQVSGSPLVAEGRVYFGQQGGNRDFYAVDLRDGRPAWKVQAGWAWVGATYSKGRVHFGTVDGDVICLNARDGRTVWIQPMNGGVHPSIAIDEERVYSGSWDG